MNHKFFRGPRFLCWWCNHNNVKVISITLVPKGGWCVFYKENSKNKEDIELAIITTNG